MNEKTLPKNYEEYYEKASIILQQTDKEETYYFANLISHNKKLRILDIGCAEGELVLLLALKGHDVTAADISKNYLEKVVKSAQENSTKIRIMKCNIEDNISQFEDEKFDVIFFMDVIEHLRNPLIALENIRHLLNDDGVLFIHTPNVFTLSRLLRYIVARTKLIDYYEPSKLADLHFQTYDYLTLEKTLNFIGLKIHEIIPTKLTLPLVCRFRFFNHFFKFLSKEFPFFSDTLLVKCKKAKPINIEQQIVFWSKDLNKS